MTNNSEDGWKASVVIDVVRCSRDFKGFGRISSGSGPEERDEDEYTFTIPVDDLFVSFIPLSHEC